MGIRVIAISLLLVLTCSDSVADLSAPDSATPIRSALLDEAMSLFDERGLELPEFEIAFSEVRQDCGGYWGVTTGNPPRIRVCVELLWVVVHELAHVWLQRNLTDGDEREFVAGVGLSHWNDHSEPWKSRGVEQAAFIIQTNLMGKTSNTDSPTMRRRVDLFDVLLKLAGASVPHVLR